MDNKDRSHTSQGARPSSSCSDKRKDVSEAKVNKLKKRLMKKDKEVHNVRKELDSLKNELTDMSRKVKQLEDENNDLLYRLSSKAAAGMTYNNPNIVDLSDHNRPTKISERFSELYDNQWTNAFINLEKQHNLSETEIIAFLLDVLYISFDECKKARSQRESALKVIKEYVGAVGDDQDLTVLEVMRTLKDARKKNVEEIYKAFKKSVEKKLTTKTSYKQKLPDIKPYMDECVEICILMNIQEPPLELRGLSYPSYTPFDLSAFRPYTESGKTIEYIVWPAMHLYRDGPILCKGIAQGMRDSSNPHQPTSVQL